MATNGGRHLKQKLNEERCPLTRFEEVVGGGGSQVVRLQDGSPGAWTLEMDHQSWVRSSIIRHSLMFPTIGSWDELGLRKCCVCYQNIETLYLLPDLFAEGVDRRIACQVKEKEFNVVKLGRFLDF